MPPKTQETKVQGFLRPRTHVGVKPVCKPGPHEKLSPGKRLRRATATAIDQGLPYGDQSRALSDGNGRGFDPINRTAEHAHDGSQMEKFLIAYLKLRMAAYPRPFSATDRPQLADCRRLRTGVHRRVATRSSWPRLSALRH